MTDRMFLHTFDAELGPDDANGNRTLSGLVVPFDVPTSRYGVDIVFTKDTTRLPEDLATVKLCVNHDTDRPAGFATSAAITADGVRMTFSVPTGVPRSAALLLDVDSKLRDGLSVGFTPDPDTMSAIFARAFGENTDTDPVPFAGVIREVSATAVPQFNEARLDTSSTPELVTFQRPEGHTMTVTTEPPVVEAHVLPTFSMEELAAELAPFLGQSHAVHPLARFSNLSEFVMAGRDGSLTPEELAAFALADQITSDNPGLMRPSWIDGIVGILNRGRPAISAFGGPGSAGDSGMRVEWPTYTGGFDGLVGVQAAEKTEVTTRKVSITKAGADLATYAGASDISYQLLRRSSPAYREAYSRILAIAYGIVTDAKFSADLVAGATGTGSWDGVSLNSLTVALFGASDAVDDAVGVPADVVLAAPDVFLAIGGLDGLKPPVYGTNNLQGTAQASTLRVNVSGLEVRKGRNLAPGSLLVGSSEAAQWLEDGPFPIEADDVAKLGRDVGIWGMGTTRLAVPGGVVKLTTAPEGLAAKTSK